MAMTVWHVTVPAIALVRAGTAEEAEAIVVAALTAADLYPYEYHRQVMESDDQTETDLFNAPPKETTMTAHISNDPLCPIPPHRRPKRNLTTLTYLMPVEVLVDLDEGTVLRVVVDDEASVPPWPKWYSDGDAVNEAHVIASESEWPEWEVA